MALEDQGPRRIYAAAPRSKARGGSRPSAGAGGDAPEETGHAVRGIADSFAFVSEPRPTASPSGSFARSRTKPSTAPTFRAIEDVRRVAGAFVDDYNRHWLLEKNHCCGPREMLQDWIAAQEMDAAA